MRRSSHTSLLRDLSHSTLCRSSPARTRQHFDAGTVPQRVHGSLPALTALGLFRKRP